MNEQDKDLSVDRWFAERGFGLRTWRDDSGEFWADLLRGGSDEVVGPRYGRGADEHKAKQRARERFLTEQ